MALRVWLPTHRWFGGKARIIQNVSVTDAVPLSNGKEVGRGKYLAMAQVEYVDGEPETYVVPLGFASGEEADRLVTQSPSPIVCQLNLRDAKETVCYLTQPPIPLSPPRYSIRYCDADAGKVMTAICRFYILRHYGII